MFVIVPSSFLLPAVLIAASHERQSSKKSSCAAAPCREVKARELDRLREL